MVQRAQRQRHREGGSSGMERAVTVAHREWVEGMGGVSVWVGSTLELVLWGGGMWIGSMCGPGISSCGSACQGGTGTAGAC